MVLSDFWPEVEIRPFRACAVKNTQYNAYLWPNRRNSRVITGSAVALHCCKAHSKINRKMGNLTPCKIVTPENFNLKLCTRDDVGEATHHANFGSNRYSRGFPPYRRNINTLWLFHLTVLSCPVLSFFSRERAQVEPLNRFSRFMAQTTCFCLRMCLLGVRMMGDVIWGKYAPKTPQKWAWIGNFKPKRQNIKITISPKLWIRSRPNFMTNLRPTIALRGWSNVIQIKYNMAAGRHLEKIDMTS